MLTFVFFVVLVVVVIIIIVIITIIRDISSNKATQTEVFRRSQAYIWRTT